MRAFAAGGFVLEVLGYESAKSFWASIDRVLALARHVDCVRESCACGFFLYSLYSLHIVCRLTRRLARNGERDGG